MPSNVYWASTSADLTAAGAWVGGVAPVAGDSIFFPASASIEPTTNLNGFAATIFAKVYTEDGCPINLGSPGAAIQLNSTEYVFFGSGNITLDNQRTTGNAIILWAPSHKDAKLLISGNNPKVFYISAGIVDIATAGVAVTTLFIARDSRSDAPTVNIVSSSDITTMHVVDGNVNYSSTVTTGIMHQYGGNVRVFGGGALSGTIMGGYCNYEASGASGWHLMGGTLDMSQGSTQKSVTAYVYPGARFLVDENITTATQYVLLHEVGEGPQ